MQPKGRVQRTFRFCCGFVLSVHDPRVLKGERFKINEGLPMMLYSSFQCEIKIESVAEGGAGLN